MKLKTNPKPATLRVRRLRDRRKRVREQAKEKDFVLWFVRCYWRERDIDAKTFVPLATVRNGLILPTDVRIADFLDGDLKFLSALGPDIEVAKILFSGRESIVIRPKFL